MPEPLSSSAVSTEALARGHEAREPHLRNVLIIAASVVVMLAFCLLVAALLAGHFSRSRAGQDMRALGIVAAPSLRPLDRFPAPALEIDDGHADWLALRRGQSDRLERYAWLDRSQGVVQIPVERAMDLLLQRGLPARTNAAPASGESPLQLIQERPRQR